MDLKEAAMFEEGAVRHPWEVSRGRAFARLLKREVGAVDRLLDVGAGDAYAAHAIGRSLGMPSVTCVDDAYRGDLLTKLQCRYPAAELRTTLPSDTFPLVTALDVVEHVDDDSSFVSSLRDRVASGGWLLVSVPAYQSLFGPHDVALGHYRRYSPGELDRLLRNAGLRVVCRGGLFASLLAVRAAERGLRTVLRRDPSAGSEPAHDIGVAGFGGGALLATALSFVLDLDTTAGLFSSRYGRGVPGLSTWSLCRAD